MSDQLAFDEKQARTIETLYMSERILARRNRALELLELTEGDTFLDLGCGPGFLAMEAAPVVGSAGQVHALDSSDNMLDMARARAGKHTESKQIQFHAGDATSLPFDDAQFDAIAVLQVYEYVGDVDKALAELHRTLKPGGRYVIIDTDWDSMVCKSMDSALTTKILGAFEGHLADPYLPRTLGSRLRAIPLHVTSVEPFVQMTEGASDTYFKALKKIISDYVRNRDGLSDGDVDEWLRGLNQLESQSATFMSLTQFFFAGIKP